MWDFATLIEEVMRALDDLVRSGKVLYGHLGHNGLMIAGVIMLADSGWSPGRPAARRRPAVQREGRHHRARRRRQRSPADHRRPRVGSTEHGVRTGDQQDRSDLEPAAQLHVVEHAGGRAADECLVPPGSRQWRLISTRRAPAARSPARFGGTVATTTSRNGARFCGSDRAQPTYWTTQTGNEAQDLYASAKYSLSDNATLFGDVIAQLQSHPEQHARTQLDFRSPRAAASSSTRTTGAYEAWTRRLSPEEIGGVDRFNRYWQETAADLTTGIRGKIGGSEWDYEAAWSGSVYRSRNTRPRLLAGIDTYFLGPQLGTDPDGVPIFAPDACALRAGADARAVREPHGPHEEQGRDLAADGEPDHARPPLRPARRHGAPRRRARMGKPGLQQPARPADQRRPLFQHAAVRTKCSGSRTRYAARDRAAHPDPDAAHRHRRGTLRRLLVRRPGRQQVHATTSGSSTGRCPHCSCAGTTAPASARPT